MNVQNIPRSLKDVKRGFIPKLDTMLYFDYVAMELRILGYYLATALKDYSLVDEINAGDDIHRITASRIYSKPLEEVTDDERQKGKTLGFALLYGGGVPTLLRQGVVETYPDGKRLIAAYHSARPGVKLLSEKLWSSYSSKGHIRLIDGHRLHPESEHKALNTLIQGTGAVIKRRAFVACYKYLANASFKSHLVNEVHDELQFDVARGELYTLVENIPTLMGFEKMDAIIPLAVDIEYTTTNWSEKRPWTGSL